ncbi:hypothetical protein EDD37DRAFT_645283 [Exophiala viscosa]|uniref:Glycosyl transferase CAP10 domain-containing protein n=1 Tax=Exophiala viscosa TaxID=2486360 RepID=A0AAN6IH60_9EURO|nr:hypothetical protein EDD36DRAFT_149059 [Exophiala viscosa]KAI1629529.1 hypothetical protein EDD37DRAFT_645283 [Exophiala viscosa]
MPNTASPFKMHRLSRTHLVVGAVILVALYQSLSYMRSSYVAEPQNGRDAGLLYHFLGSNTTQPTQPLKYVSSSADLRKSSGITVDSIGQLIANANTTFEDLMAKKSTSLNEAANTYRIKRGRHPPPGFDQWYEYAISNDAIIIEDFFDQIYHDLEPFWALSARDIRDRARNLGMHVSILNATAEANTGWFWHVIWASMINEVAYMLPNMVIPLNAMDEPRLMVPFEDITTFVAEAHNHRVVPHPEQVTDTITGWTDNVEPDQPYLDIEWSQSAPLSFARAACAPDSPLRSEPTALHLNMAVQPEHEQQLNFMLDGFIRNFTLASDVCQDASIAAYHGALTSPLTASTSRDLLPLFGGSKFAVNNDILIPAPMYWNGEERFDVQDENPWSSKTNRATWRGTATGGRHNALNWPNFHRHRFVALTNGTKYSLADETSDRIFTSLQQRSALSPLPANLQKNMSLWITKHNDIAFTDMFCDIPSEESQCWYLSNEYAVTESMSLSDQYSSKFLPDIDGNSFSGRYRSFLQSNSVPIKATLYREWHDSRLISWKHFVPMNNRFTDYYAILSYFVGCDEDLCGSDGKYDGHDSEGEEIARAGREWAEKVLRKVDMQIYAARLLLEYGRLTDDNRDSLGWVEDLKYEDLKSVNQTTDVADP